MSTAESNALIEEWPGPYGGVPPFDRMNLEDLKPALEAGMAVSLREIDAIAANPEPPTFKNTIVAMEASGRLLDRVHQTFGVWSANLSTPEFREIEQEMAPRLAEFNSRITQNAGLFARIKGVYEGNERGSLSPSQQRLVWLLYDSFARNGATLEGDARERYSAINQRLAELHTRFSNNVLEDEEGYVHYLTREQLTGVPSSFVETAAVAATEHGHDGEYAITNTRSSTDPFLTYSAERDLREKVWRTFYNRGNNGDKHDNNAIITEILELRHERVQLLGYPNYATWRLENRMAQTPARALALMEQVWPAALVRVSEEVTDMQALADSEGAGIKIAPWDYRYYAEKVRESRYALDSDQVRLYLQLDKLREAMFFVAGELFNYAFSPVLEESVPVFHDDVRVWEVTDKTSGRHIGVWYLDPYARPGKGSGAWATTYRRRESFDGERTVLGSNNSNFIKGPPAKPVMVSWDDARTLFHEFGHALHYFSSRVDYPSLNGALRDYIEFQSQLMERWLLTDEVTNNYLLHHETGAPIPKDLVAKISNAATFNQGFATTEYLACALVDMRYHTIDPTGIDPQKFEREVLTELMMPEEIVMRHRSTHFGHVFSGEGYSAGYYGYMWADVLTADAAEAFANSPGGFYDKKLARKLVDHLFAPQNSVDPADAYRAFCGRDAGIAALMRDRGFPET